MSGADVLAAPAFDVRGPLPEGTVVLEASAGTGKTWTIAALAARYVAEGTDLRRMMLVTFGRAATAELRDRVRSRLVSVDVALREPDPRASSDELVAFLAAVDDEELAARRLRLARAVADFDAATIATTHGFCQQMLAGLGVAGDGDQDPVFVPDVEDLREEVVDDLYLATYAGDTSPGLSVEDARSVAKEAVGDPQARLAPDDADPGSPAAHRYAFATAVRREVLRRKRNGQIQDYDDLLQQLSDALHDPVTGAQAVRRVRSLYDVVLVDEFQDTDPLQWDVLRTAFHGHRALVLIGDPKQAIYAFRGADLTTYLRATAEAGSHATLGRNWRSDAGLLTALERVLAGIALGDDRIVVHPVESQHAAPRLTSSPPFRLRVVPRDVVDDPKAGRLVSTDPARALVAADVAADVVRQLSSGVRVTVGDEVRALEPGDIAVVTPTNKASQAVLAALAAARVPAVQSGFASVFGTPAARDWLALLTALDQPARATLVGAAALTPFLGRTAHELATATDEQRDRVTGTVRRWARVQAERGVAALLEVVLADGLAERVLAGPDGERTMTDLRHIGQALHEAAVAEDLGPASTVEWLRTRMEEATVEYVDERSRRLESDAAAVQVLTVHASKGLEFPVVYAPFLWDRWDNDRPAVLLHHDDAGNRVLDVGGPTGPRYDRLRALHATEDRDEDLRLMYVALTRARSQVIAWWAPTFNTRTSPLHRLLFAGTFPGTTPGETVDVPNDATAWARLAPLGQHRDGTVAVERVERVAPTVWTPPPTDAQRLDVARFDRTLDTGWTRTSYTGLTRAVHEAQYESATAATGVMSEPEDAGTDDEVGADGVVGTGPGPADDVLPSPMADLPGGAAFGTLVHGVLEEVDTDAADLDAELRLRCGEATSARIGGVDGDALAASLGPVMATPLGPLAGGVSLAGVANRDRLSEMDFELPLAGGDVSDRTASTLAGVADALRRHLPPSDPLAGYADLLAAEPLGEQQLRGYLTGSLDAVLRVRVDGQVRYLVADYKTNWLGPPEVALTTWQYRPTALVEAMLDAHYPLQLLLYLVALHRFLRWRQPGYDPDVHLGGGLYLFVRGMAGPGTPVTDGVPAGVFSWRPPAALVVELSALLDGAPARRAS